MNKKAKQKWIAALTEGRYKQICSYMKKPITTSLSDEELDERNKKMPWCEFPVDVTSNKVCVMGVLADLAFRDSGLKPTEENWLKFADENEKPSDRTLEWAGIKDDECNLIDDMIRMNDSKRTTFKKFAKFIEKKFEST